jgi:hypothetical protein
MLRNAPEFPINSPQAATCDHCLPGANSRHVLNPVERPTTGNGHGQSSFPHDNFPHDNHICNHVKQN